MSSPVGPDRSPVPWRWSGQQTSHPGSPRPTRSGTVCPRTESPRSPRSPRSRARPTHTTAPLDGISLPCQGNQTEKTSKQINKNKQKQYLQMVSPQEERSCELTGRTRAGGGGENSCASRGGEEMLLIGRAGVCACACVWGVHTSDSSCSDVSLASTSG